MPSRAVLKALRAAAILIVATGLNEIVAGAVPRYEPLYLYAAAAALVTLMDGLLIGTLAAGIATLLAALLFRARPSVLDASILAPAAVVASAVVGASIVGALVRGASRNRRRRIVDEPPVYRLAQPLLEARLPGPTDEIVTALEEMRAELRMALTDLAAARERERALELEARSARATAGEDAERIVAGANRAVDALSRRVQQVEEHAQSREAKLEQAWAEAREQLMARARDLEMETHRLRAEVAIERQRAETATARAADMQSSAERAGAEIVTARLETSELTRKTRALEASVAALSAERDAAVASRDASKRQARDLAASVAATEARLAQMQAGVESLTGERDAARSTSSSLAARVEELEHQAAERAGAQQELEVTAVAERLRKVTAERDAARAELSERRAAATAAESRREKLEADVERLTSERDTAESTAARLAARIEELEEALEATADQTSSDLVGVRLELAQAQQQAADLQSQLEAAMREHRDLAAAAQQAQAAADEQLRTAASETRDRDARAATLQARVSELESAIHQLTAERDELAVGAARAQAELEEKLVAMAAAAGEREARAADLEDRLSELESALARMTGERDDLAGSAARAQEEFDEKLQSIVAHLAEDHEADLGNALMEKEAAKAEARALTTRVAQLQQKVDEEAAKWMEQIQALTTKLQQAEERAARAVEDTTRVMTDARAAWRAELERLRARVGDLEAPVRPTLDLRMPIPMPPPPDPEPLRRILVAHPDADLREAARSSLERAGYDVTTAGDGLEGLKIAIATHPDVVIADAVMPKMNGRELCQLLKSQQKTAHIKIVLLTRAGVELPMDHELGPDEVLKKPVPFETLRTSLNALLNG